MNNPFFPMSETLLALQEDYFVCFPEAAARLSAGLSNMEIDTLEAQLRPYRLSTELRTLYGWHDGVAYDVSPVPPTVLLSLAGAIESRRFMMEVLGPLGCWNPLWLPIFDRWDGYYYFTVLSPEAQEFAPVFDFSKAATEVVLMATSVSAFMQAASVCMRRDDIRYVDGRMESPLDDLDGTLRQIALGGQPNRIDGETEFSVQESENWPQAWLRAAGVMEETYVQVGATCGILDFLARPDREVVHGRIVGLMGGLNGRLMEVSDGTNSLTVFCSADCVGISRAGMGVRAEFAIEPCHGPLPLPFETADAVAVKIVPLS